MAARFSGRSENPPGMRYGYNKLEYFSDKFNFENEFRYRMRNVRYLVLLLIIVSRYYFAGIVVSAGLEVDNALFST